MGWQQHLLGQGGGAPNRETAGKVLLRGPSGLEPVPRGKCGSPKESQKQKFAQWLLWLWGRAAVKCSSACWAVSKEVTMATGRGG